MLTAHTSDAVALLTRFAATGKITELMELVAQLDKSFKDIAGPAKRPEIMNNDINEKFATALEAAGAISSYSFDGGHIQINTFRGDLET